MAYDLGDVVPLAFSVVDAAGEPMNAGTVTLTITLPDGTLDSPGVANPPAATGLYRYDYVPTQAGRHLARWVSTSPSAAYTDGFDVRPGDPLLIVSLADVKQHLNKSIDDTSDDEELRVVIEAATAAVEDLRGEVVVRRTVAEDLNVAGGAWSVALTHSPVISLTSVASVDGTTMWDVADLHVSRGGIVTATAGSAFYGLVRFTYVAGYQVIPANFTLAAKIIAAHLWLTQQQPGLGPSPFGADAETLTPVGLGYAVPNRAVQLLGSRRPLVA